jgi:hypothetical protein
MKISKNENKLVKDNKLVIVSWFDSSSMAQWSSQAEINNETLHCSMQSVGWLTRDTDELIAVSANAGNAYFGHTTFIPRVNIIEIKELT